MCRTCILVEGNGVYLLCGRGAIVCKVVVEDNVSIEYAHRHYQQCENVKCKGAAIAISFDSTHRPDTQFYILLSLDFFFDQNKLYIGF